MTRTFAIFNMKGGVGKSTTAYNLAVGLMRFKNQRVLLVDIDPQGHSSVALGIPIWELEKQIRDVLTERCSMRDALIRTSSGVEVLPSNVLLAEEEIPISGLPGRELLLRKVLSSVQDDYDVILIDYPPNVGVFSINALMASDGVIVPVDMSYLGLLGINGIERTLDLIRNRLDHPIEIAGVLGTRFDVRNNLSKTVLDKLHGHFGDRTYKTVIPETVKLREAPSYSQSIFDYDPNGAGAKAYQALVEEVMG